MKQVRLAVAAAMLAGLFAALPASPALACTGAAASRPGTRHGTEVVRLETFEVTIRAVKKRYRIGDTARIAVTVRRPAKRDPLGQGITWNPPEQYAASDVSVGVGLRVNDVFLSGWGRTNEAGKVTIEVPIPRYVRPGRALAVAQAAQRAVESPCLTVEEWGFTQSPNLFRIS